MNSNFLSARVLRDRRLYFPICSVVMATSLCQAQDLLTQYQQSVQFPYSDPQPTSCARVGTLDLVAMANQGGGLLIFDNSNPHLLKPIGFHPGDSLQPSGIDARGNLVVVGDSGSGIHFLDVSNPENPTLIVSFGDYNSIDPLNTVFDVWIEGNHCIALGSEEVYIVDISTPATPAIVGRLAHTFPYGTTQGAHTGNQIFFAVGEQGLQVLDFSNPAAPSIVGGLTFTDQYAQSIVLDGTTAYLGLGGSVAIVDVTNVSNPTLISSVALPDFAAADFLGKVGDALYVIGYQAFHTLDVADPNQVMEMGGVTQFLGQVADVNSVDDQLILLTNDGYKIFDATEEFAPKLLSRFDRWDRVNGMAETGDYLAFVKGFSGFGFADISQNFPYVDQLLDTGGYMADVAAGAAHAFGASGTRGLQVIDLSDPLSPSLLTTLPLTGFAWGIDLVGTTAYVAIDDKGIVAVDVSVPQAPVVLDTLLLPGNTMDVSVTGNYAYVSCYSAGVQVVDVSNPASLSLIGAFDTDGRAQRTQLSGNTLYVADGLGGIVILDVTTPPSPVLVQKIPTVRDLQDVAVEENGWTLIWDDPFNPYKILDLSDPTRPKLYPTTQFVNGGLNSARLVNGEIYLGGTFLDSYSIVPNPSFSSVFTWPGFPAGQPTRMACDQNFLYLAGGMAGLVIYDITNPGEPDFAGHYSADEFGSFVDVVLHGALAYVSGNVGVEIVDVSNPYIPRRVGSIPVDYGVRTVKIHNGLAFVSEEFVGVGIYDLSDPANPTPVGFYENENTTITGMEFLSTYGYFCAGYGGMIIMDLSDPANPVEIFTDDFEEGVWDVQLEGDVLYVSTDSAVKVVSVANPQIPIVIAPAEIYGNQQQLHVVGTTAYTADAVYGMVIVDASMPAVPLISSSTLIQGGGATGIRVCGNFAYVAGSTQLQVFDVSTPVSPSLAKVIPISAGYEIVVKSGDVMVAGGDNLNPNSTISIFTRQESDWVFTNLIIEESPQAMQFVGNILYLASFGRIYIYDLVNPSDPQLLSDFDPGGTAGVNAIDVNGNHLYVASNGGVYVHDITNLENPLSRGSWISTATPYDIVVSGNHAFVADSFNGLQVLDVTNPLSPNSVTVLQPQIGELYQLSLDESRLLAMGQSSAALIDISDPTAPTQIGQPFYPSIGGITDGVLEGDTVFFVSGGSLESLNVSDTSTGWAPRIGSYVSPPTLSSLIRDNGETYAGGSGLRVLRDVVFQPALSIKRDGISLEINWSPTGGGFQLEQRPSPGEGSWEPVLFAQPPYFDNFTELLRIYRLSR